jgi:hypothetical protein
VWNKGPGIPSQCIKHVEEQQLIFFFYERLSLILKNMYVFQQKASDINVIKNKNIQGESVISAINLTYREVT